MVIYLAIIKLFIRPMGSEELLMTDGWFQAELPSFPSEFTCAACPHIGVPPLRPAVARPEDLCMVHRARATQGACVICGRRLPWMEIQRGIGIGSYRASHGATWREEEVIRLEESWKRLP